MGHHTLKSELYIICSSSAASKSNTLGCLEGALEEIHYTEEQGFKHRPRAQIRFTKTLK